MNKGLTLSLAGIAALALLYVFRLAIADLYVNHMTEKVDAAFDQMQRKESARMRAIKERQEASRAEAAVEKQRRLEARCYVLTADGRKLTCAE